MRVYQAVETTKQQADKTLRAREYERSTLNLELSLSVVGPT